MTSQKHALAPGNCGIGILTEFTENTFANDTTLRLGDGIVIKEVVAGGQAGRDGLLRPGDMVTGVVEGSLGPHVGGAPD